MKPGSSAGALSVVVVADLLHLFGLRQNLVRNSMPSVWLGYYLTYLSVALTIFLTGRGQITMCFDAAQAVLTRFEIFVHY